MPVIDQHYREWWDSLTPEWRREILSYTGWSIDHASFKWTELQQAVRETLIYHYSTHSEHPWGVS